MNHHTREGRMDKVCFVMKVKPEWRENYIEIHKKDNVWPSVIEALKKRA